MDRDRVVMRKENGRWVASSDFYRFRIEFILDECGDALLTSVRGAGIYLGEFEEVADWAAEEEAIEEYFADQEAVDENAAALEEEAERFRRESSEKYFEFYHDKDVKILNETPEVFFRLLDLKKDCPEITGEGAREKIPQPLRAELEQYYEIEYSFRIGYPVCFIRGLRKEYADRLNYFPDMPCALLFFDPSRLFGIIQFMGTKRGFVEEWNNHCGLTFSNYPKMYLNDSGRLLLVKQFDLDGAGRFAEHSWNTLFNNFPPRVLKQRREFMQKVR